MNARGYDKHVGRRRWAPAWVAAILTLACGAQAGAQPTDCYTVDIPPPARPLNVSVFVDGAPQVAVMANPNARGQAGMSESDLWLATMSTSGEPGTAARRTSVYVGPGLESWVGFDAVQTGATVLVAYQRIHALGFGLVLGSVPEGGALRDLGWASIPGFNSPRVHSPAAAGLFDPRMCRVEDSLWLACGESSRGGIVGVASCSGDAWDTWTTYERLGPGCYPNVCGVRDHGLFVSFSRAAVASAPHIQEGGAPQAGPLVMARRRDGGEWEAPRPCAGETAAHSSAVAVDPDAGLVVCFSAAREEGWPLFACRSPDFGETWGAPVMLTPPDARTMRPDAVIHDGKLFVGFMEWDGDSVVARTCAIDPAELLVE